MTTHTKWDVAGYLIHIFTRERFWQASLCLLPPIHPTRKTNFGLTLEKVPLNTPYITIIYFFILRTFHFDIAFKEYLLQEKDTPSLKNFHLCHPNFIVTHSNKTDVKGTWNRAFKTVVEESGLDMSILS